MCGVEQDEATFDDLEDAQLDILGQTFGIEDKDLFVVRGEVGWHKRVATAHSIAVSSISAKVNNDELNLQHNSIKRIKTHDEVKKKSVKDWKTDPK